jgi:hypothetical protein
MPTETEATPQVAASEDGGPALDAAALAREGSSADQILQALAALRAEVSALRSELLGQSQQMLSRMQFLHEGLVGRIKQIREQPTQMRRRPIR